MSDTVHTQATALLSGSPFGYLIGAPMVAAIDAQGLAAMETVKFIEAVGFTSSGVPPVTTAQTVTFTYTKPVTPAGAAAARPPRRERRISGGPCRRAPRRPACFPPRGRVPWRCTATLSPLVAREPAEFAYCCNADTTLPP